LFIRELLLLQSIFFSPSGNEIIELVNMQTNREILTSSFLELDRRNMISILAFDSKAIQSILDQRFESSFSMEFPLIYKNKKQIIGIYHRQGRKKMI
jgi:hypothetical protein